MNGARRFSAAPVNFDRFIVLARSYSRSLSPDRELDQILRPFQDRRTTTTNATKREPPASRVATSQPRHQQRGTGELINNELVATQVLDREPYWGSAQSVATKRSTAAEKACSSTRAATSTSRSVSGGAAVTSSVTSTDFSRSTLDDSCVGEETQELGRNSYSADDVDPLLHAVLQLGSPLYDPVKRQFVCWRLHTLEKRPRSAYGSIEGVSCDFCGHTDWIEEMAERAMTSPSVCTSVVKVEGKEDLKAPSVGAPLPAQVRLFYHCSICQVDICRACLAEVRSDERFHVPCLQCQRCGVFEKRQNAPLHRCAEVRVINVDDEVEVSKGALPLLMPPSRNTDALLMPPTAPPLPSSSTVSATMSSKYKSTWVGGRVRVGLSRPHQRAVKGEAAPDAAVAARVEKSAGSVPHRKRKRASPVATSAPKQRLKEEANGSTEMSQLGDVRDKTYQQLWQSSSTAMPKPASPKQKEANNADGSASRALLEATGPPYPRYEVHLTPRTPEEVGEVGRIAREQHLVCSPAPSLARACVFYFATRLAAETCVDRATVASLEAVLKCNAKPACSMYPSPLPF
ncbi:hypothetical protein MNV84_03248 [Leishmania braziliensis]|nr:hypothetical protein MNV84_03248 [Leishmania braziliensis]